MIRPLLAAGCLTVALLGCTAAPADPARMANRTVAPPPVPGSGEVAGPGVERYHVNELRPGDCIEPMPVDAIVTVVPCTEPHTAEFATTYVVPDGPWPGMAEVERLAMSGCEPRMRYVPSRRGEVGVTGLFPVEESWPRHRTAFCMAVALDGGKLVGRVIL